MNEEHLSSQLYTLEQEKKFITFELSILNNFFYVLNFEADFISWESKVKLATSSIILQYHMKARKYVGKSP